MKNRAFRHKVAGIRTVALVLGLLAAFVLAAQAGAWLPAAGEPVSSAAGQPAEPVVDAGGPVPGPALAVAASFAAVPVQPALAQGALQDATRSSVVAEPRSGSVNLHPSIWLPLLRHKMMLSTRLGFDSTTNITIYPELASLKAGWYQDWNTREAPARPNGMEYAQLVGLHQKLDCPLSNPNAYDRTKCPYSTPYDYFMSVPAATIVHNAQANPGSLWMIGNEMDRRDYSAVWIATPAPGHCEQTGYQNDMLPEVYAKAYHDLYTLIKAADPTARIAIGGVVEVTPLRLEYLDKVWAAYNASWGPMPVDVWNLHAFILKEDRRSWGASVPPGSDVLTGVLYPDNDPHHLDMAVFDNMMRSYRQWMKDHGQQNKPLIISEYGVLLMHETIHNELLDPATVQGYMINTFDYLLNTTDCSLGQPGDGCRLVQAWTWCSVDEPSYNPLSRLFNRATLQITNTGVRFRDYSLTHMVQLAR